MPEVNHEVRVIHETDRLVVGAIRYTIIFDKKTGSYSCTCVGNAAFNKECKHIRGLRDELGREIAIA